ncbi:MAG: murein biosynthesis integral membrane protein MurJ [Eubacterium sp.]|nr:murein biosynthesis integral membrane protein MurJ [Eubacterium sp.]
MSEAKKKHGQSLFAATSIMAALSLVASLLGFVRNIIMTTIFGMGIELDSYYAAFRIPDFLYMILVGGALSSAFIPVFGVYITTGEEEKGYKMASTVLNLVLVFATVFCLIGEIFTPQLIELTTRFAGEKFDLTVRLTRIMFCQCFFMCMTGVAMGICMSYKNFVPSSVGGVLYNLSIIVFGLLFSQVFDLGIAGFSISVVCGAVFNLLAHVRPIRREGFKYYPIIDMKHDGVHKFFKLFWPMLLGISVTQLNLLVNQYFASGLEDSTIAAMSNAQTIMELPINLFGGSIAVAIFPTMAEHFAKGQIDDYKKDLSVSMRATFFLAIPISAGLIALRVPLVRAMYYQGNFTDENLELVSSLLMFYSLGILGYCCRLILSRGFYSAEDTKTPVRINITILTLNIVLSMIFVNFWGAKGLALAYSTAGFFSMGLLFTFLRRKMGTIRGKEMIISAIKSVIAAGIMCAVIVPLRYGMESFMQTDGKIYHIIQLGVLFVIGVVSYFVAAYFLKMQELKMVLDMVKRKFGRRKKKAEQN